MQVFIFTEESWKKKKMYHGFQKDIKQHNF